MSVRRCAAVLLLLASIAGCATGHRARPVPPEGACLPPGRTVILSRVSTEENRAIGADAVDQLANALRGAAQVIGGRELVSEAATVGLGLWAADSVFRVERGGRLAREDGQILWDRFGVRSVIIADVKVYEQVWGQRAKFTRAGIDALAVDLVADQVVWTRHGDAELEDNRGRAFQLAMEQAVQGLASSICPHPTDFSVSKMWRDYHR